MLHWRLKAELLMYENERIPAKGTDYSFFGFGFKVLETNKNRITSICVTPPKEGGEE
jgi:Mg2+/Co2+ transporter CorB